MKYSVLTMLFACGCSAVGVYAPGFEAGVEAAINSGLPVELSEDPDAPLVIEKRNKLKNMWGIAFDAAGCKRTAYVKAGSPDNVTAHEIGHMLGLQHLDQENNLMKKIIDGDDTKLTAKQRKISRLTAAAVETCRILKEVD